MTAVSQPTLTRVRWGVGILFFINAVAFASVVPRYVNFREAFSIDNAVLGLVIAAGPVGALAAGLIAGRLVRGIGSAPAAVASSALLGVNLVVMSFASDAWSLAILLFTAGVLDSTGDIANNAHGLGVQRAMGRSVISGLHGIWSIGAIAGGVAATIAAASGVAVSLQFQVTGVVIALASVAIAPLLRMPRADASSEAESSRGASVRFALRPFLVILWIGIAGAMLEDTVSTWGGIYLVDIVGVAEANSGISFIVFMVALTTGRLLGDGAVDRFGARRVLAAGAVSAAAGMLLAIAVATLWASLIGFSLVGLGIATMIPLAMHAADEAPGLRAGAGLTIASVVTRVGLMAPPVIGALADATSLRVALLIAPVVALSVALFAVRMKDASNDRDAASVRD